jgi:hypothetical protein
MTAADFAPIIQTIIAGIAAVIAALISIYVPKAIAAFEARTHIQLTDQQRSQVMSAASTAAGILETQLDQGALKLEHVTPTNPAILAQAQAAIARVPDAAAALNKTVPSMAETIVGLMDTKPPVAVLPLAPSAPLATTAGPASVP